VVAGRTLVVHGIADMPIAAVVIRGVDVEIGRAANPLSERRKNGVGGVARPVSIPDVVDVGSVQDERSAVIADTVRAAAAMARLSLALRIPLALSRALARPGPRCRSFSPALAGWHEFVVVATADDAGFDCAARHGGETGNGECCNDDSMHEGLPRLDGHVVCDKTRIGATAINAPRQYAAWRVDAQYQVVKRCRKVERRCFGVSPLDDGCV